MAVARNEDQTRSTSRRRCVSLLRPSLPSLPNARFMYVFFSANIQCRSVLSIMRGFQGERPVQFSSPKCGARFSRGIAVPNATLPAPLCDVIAVKLFVTMCSHTVLRSLENIPQTNVHHPRHIKKCSRWCWCVGFTVFSCPASFFPLSVIVQARPLRSSHNVLCGTSLTWPKVLGINSPCCRRHQLRRGVWVWRRV